MMYLQTTYMVSMNGPIENISCKVFCHLIRQIKLEQEFNITPKPTKNKTIEEKAAIEAKKAKEAMEAKVAKEVKEAKEAKKAKRSKKGKKDKEDKKTKRA